MTMKLVYSGYEESRKNALIVGLRGCIAPFYDSAEIEDDAGRTASAEIVRVGTFLGPFTPLTVRRIVWVM
jgi:hypothetical protein